MRRLVGWLRSRLLSDVCMGSIWIIYEEVIQKKVSIVAVTLTKAVWKVATMAAMACWMAVS